MKTQLKYIISFVACILFIFGYGSYRCRNPKYKDILEKSIGIGELDGWSMTHFLFFLYLGYTFPRKEYLIIAVIMGIAWELFEHFYGKYRPGWLGGYGDCQELASDKTDDGNWWYGKWTDIVMNTSGLFIGYLIRMKLKPPKK